MDRIITESHREGLAGIWSLGIPWHSDGVMCPRIQQTLSLHYTKHAHQLSLKGFQLKEEGIEWNTIRTWHTPADNPNWERKPDTTEANSDKFNALFVKNFP